MKSKDLQSQSPTWTRYEEGLLKGLPFDEMYPLVEEMVLEEPYCFISVPDIYKTPRLCYLASTFMPVNINFIPDKIQLAVLEKKAIIALSKMKLETS